MKKVYVLTLSAMIALSGCGGGSSSESETSINAAQVTIDSTEKASVAYAAIFNSGLTSVTTLAETSLGGVIPTSSAPSMRQAINSTNNCMQGGTLNAAGNVEASGSVDMTMTFSDCAQSGTYMNGQVKLQGTVDSQTKSADISMRFLGLTVNTGEIDSYYDMSVNYSANANGYSYLINGSFSAKKGAESLDFTYDQLLLQANAAKQRSIDGKVQIITEPSSCANGAYTLETLVPINADKTAGEIKINGILFSYQSDGSVTATLDGKPAAINTSGNASCTASGQ